MTETRRLACQPGDPPTILPAFAPRRVIIEGYPAAAGG